MPVDCSAKFAAASAYSPSQPPARLDGQAVTITSKDPFLYRASTSAGSYGRKSDPNEMAVNDQHRTNTTRAAKDGYVMLPECLFSDDATSGLKVSRNGLNQLLELIQSGQAPFTRLYIRDRDRLARSLDPRFVSWFEYECKRFNVQVCYSTDENHVHFGDRPESHEDVSFILGVIKNMFANKELVATKLRTRRGVRIKLKNGCYVNSEAPFGFSRWLVCDATGAFVAEVPNGRTMRMPGHHYRLRVLDRHIPAFRFIFDSVVERKHDAQIARELNELKYPTPGNGPWLPKMIREIVTNPLCKGDYIFNRALEGEPVIYSGIDPEVDLTTPVIHSNFVPEPPISRELWDLANEILAARLTATHGAKASSPRYLLTRLLFCDYCGSGLHGHRQALRKIAGRVMMYRHPPTRVGLPACPHENRYLHAEPLENAAFEATSRYLESDEMLQLSRTILEDLETAARSSDGELSLADAESSYLVAEAAAISANTRAATATSEMEVAIHAATVKQMMAKMVEAGQHVTHLREKAVALAKAAARIPMVETELQVLRDAFCQGAPDDRKRVVSAVIERMDVDLSTDTVRLRVRAM